MSICPSFQKELWHRIEFEQFPIYIHPDGPDWFIPNSRGDAFIQQADTLSSNCINSDAIRFIKRLPIGRSAAYLGRAHYLTLDRLNELWFHLTNQCNLSCAHCLFSSSPKDSYSLSFKQIISIAEDAHRLGTRLFALTGGEPFVHPDIIDIIDGLLKPADSHLVVLTNGMNLPEVLPAMRPMDTERFHLQISIDGTAEAHDAIRGPGTHQKLEQNLDWLSRCNIPCTLSMCVTETNVQDMAALVDFAAEHGVSNIHFMWCFLRGRAQRHRTAPVETIFENLIRAAMCAEARQITIDNIEALKTQVFAPRGTKHDGSGAGWESLAIGPDGLLYPSAALVGIAELATDISGGLESAWRSSPVLKAIRQATAAGLTSPLRFITGGGDSDHSYVHNRTFIGDDPYHALYEKTALWLMTREARQQPERLQPQLRLCMGEILESCGAHGNVSLTHSNCLLAISKENSLSVVRRFYAQAAGDKKEDILNPVCYDEALIHHIPSAYRFRGYGCGSPVLDAAVQHGEHVIDLGCGAGVECFIAARLVGKHGRVTGVDMLDPMLSVAEAGAAGVAKNLGFTNLTFQKGYLESLPVEKNCADVVISNCVMNLSVNKRKAYGEILRVLRPGGRMVISDVVCQTEPDAAIRNDEILRGECIAGAMVQHQLIRLLEETGFVGIQLIKRFPYRTVQGHVFYSLTYSAVKPKVSESVNVIYRGPLPYLKTHDGLLLLSGEVQTISQDEADRLGDQVFVLDEAGNVTNVKATNSCACYVSPGEKPAGKKTVDSNFISLFPRQTSGCMVCGAPITYLPEEQICRCAYCQREVSSNARCEKGHHVCDACHAKDALKVILQICTHTVEIDMIRLFSKIRKHPAVPVNGPEHHALVPGVILATYRNLGGEIPISLIETGIKRGATVAGGHCAFMGICGAAIGVGIAFSLILEANPLTPKRRQIVQNATQSALSEIARFQAARCCQRDSWLALKKAAVLSEQILPIPLSACEHISCEQQSRNKECMGRGCPLFKQQRQVIWANTNGH